MTKYGENRSIKTTDRPQQYEYSSVMLSNSSIYHENIKNT